MKYGSVGPFGFSGHKHYDVFSPPITGKIYCSWQGRAFGSWIDADDRTANGYDEGGLIENPAYIIESLLRDEVGLTSSEIDFSAFDIVGNGSDGLRDSWIFANSMTTQGLVRDIIDEICYEAHLICYENNLGKHTIKALDTDTTTTLIIDQTQMAREPLLNKTHVSNIYNQFVFNYNYNYWRDKFDGQYRCNEAVQDFSGPFNYSNFTPYEPGGIGIDLYGGSTTDSLCGVSQTRYKKVSLLPDIDFQWIKDAITAKYSAKKFIENLYAPRLILDILGWWGDPDSTIKKPLIAYEKGDQCWVSHPVLDEGISDTFIFMVTGKSIIKSEKLVNLTLTQMR
jgi:hypothetical protein